MAIRINPMRRSRVSTRADDIRSLVGEPLCALYERQFQETGKKRLLGRDRRDLCQRFVDRFSQLRAACPSIDCGVPAPKAEDGLSDCYDAVQALAQAIVDAR